MRKGLTLLLIILLIGCKSYDDNSNRHSVVDLEEAICNSKCIALSQYVESLEYIPLETSDISMIGEAPKYQISGNHLFYNYVNSSCIGVFNVLNGKFVKKIERQGRGPGEYLSCRIFDVGQNSEIIIRDVKKIVRYNSQDSCIQSIPIGFLGTGNTIIANDLNKSYIINETCLEYDRDNKEILNEYCTIIDSTEVPSRIKIGSRDNAFSERLKFYLYKGDIKIINGARDTIFILTPDYSTTTSYIIKLGKYEYLREFTHRKTKDYFYEPALGGIIESENFLLLIGVLPENELPQIYTKNNYDKHCYSYILYDKKENKTYALKKPEKYDYVGFVDDINNGMPFCPICIAGNKMYQFIDSADFIELAEQHNVPRMKEIAATLTEESNPVMVVATLKE